MTVAEILNSVKFVVTPDGHQSAVVVDLDVWEQIVILLEDAEDTEEIIQARAIKEETIPWKTAKKELKLGIGVSC
ncbi:MAG: hypothetical protein Q7U34_06310 [Anaerolineales bacterium]|nr:hypothetical protein [Anaerolineales bacterium]MDO9348433.1 hypothetical protein [Anaerolineales bacterium]